VTIPARALADLQENFPGVRPAEPLARHTTWGIGGPADFFVEIGSRNDLAALRRWGHVHGVPLMPIGQGSNLLVGDGGVRGGVVRLRGEFEEVRFQGDAAHVGAGVLLPRFARQAAERGLTGAEPLCGIPGTLGGGLRTNAGTPEGDLGALVESVDLMDGEGRVRTVPRAELLFGYRRADLGDGWALSAQLKLRRGDRNDILSSVDKQLARRTERQPLGTKNCGSVFKNPPGDFAARLIEAAGLKGRRIGGARLSPKHANFIENVDNASAADVRQLIALIQNTVRDRFGTALELEVWTVGE
jgi:UDP-N-acetylmuramate dehydrogenase